MDSKCITTSSSWHPTNYRNTKIKSLWIHLKNTTSISKFMVNNSSIKYRACYCHHKKQKKSQLVKSASEKVNKALLHVKEKPIKAASEKKGTIAGAVALIIGTSIGSGILALPQKASLAGLLPSSLSMVLCWGFLLIEALLLIEINVFLRRRLMRKYKKNEVEVISISTMAHETLGEWGGTLASVTYVFLGYTSMVSYCSKSGEILFHFINLPAPLSAFFFTSLFTLLITLGGTKATDQVNQCLTASMIGLLVAIEILEVASGGWSGFDGSGDWGKVPATLPVMIFSLVYHDLAPYLCAYLGSDLKRLRVSVLLGSTVPLLALLVWDAVALGLSNQSDQIVDPVELLLSVRWNGVSYMVEAFSILAVVTSLVGTLVGFSTFYKEQLGNLLSKNSTSTPLLLQSSDLLFGVKKWWGRNKISFTAIGMVVAPSLFISTTVPDAFSAATDIAGGYCMTMLYGILPPAMAWAMYNSEDGEDADQKSSVSKARPLLLGIGLFACAIVVEQVLQDISTMHF